MTDHSFIERGAFKVKGEIVHITLHRADGAEALGRMELAKAWKLVGDLYKALKEGTNDER